MRQLRESGTEVSNLLAISFCLYYYFSMLSNRDLQLIESGSDEEGRSNLLNSGTLQDLCLFNYNHGPHADRQHLMLAGNMPHSSLRSTGIQSTSLRSMKLFSYPLERRHLLRKGSVSHSDATSSLPSSGNS